jgi:hypothetical protein
VWRVRVEIITKLICEVRVGIITTKLVCRVCVEIIITKLVCQVRVEIITTKLVSGTPNLTGGHFSGIGI